MLKHGLYEQVLNKLFEGKIAEVDRERYYIGERQISKEEVARLLSTYLTAIFEQHLSSISNLSYSKELGSRMQMQIIWKMLEAIPGSVMHYARIKEIA